MKRILLLGVVLSVVMLMAAGVLLWFGTRTPPVDDQAADIHAQKGAAYLQQHLYRAAIEEFEAATRSSPRALDPWIGLAAVYIRMGDGMKAVEGAAKAANIARESSAVQIILGRAHWLAQDLDQAEEAALKAQELDGGLQATELLLRIYFDRHDDKKFRELLDETDNPTPDIQDLAVRFAVRNGEFRDAYETQTRFERRRLESEVLRAQLALKRDRSQTDLYPLLIKNLVRLGRSAEAIAARREYKGSAPLDIEMGKAYWLTDNRDEAIRAFDSASRDATHKLSAEVALATLTKDRRHWDQAFRAERVETDYFFLARLEEPLESAAPLEKVFIYRYAGLFDIDLLNKAAEQAQLVLKTEPDQFEALMSLGTAYFRLGRIDDAIRYVRQGGDRYPQRAEVWSRLGQLQLAKQDSIGALSSMEKAIALEPSNPSYLYNYAWLLDQTDREREAVPYYERAIAASPLSYEAMNNLALIEAANGHTQRAIDLLNRAVISNPENEAAYMNRGNFYADQQFWRKALDDYARAERLNPANGLAAVESARTHIELNRPDIAIEELNDALDADSNIREAYVLLSSAYKKRGRERESAAALEEAKRIKGAK